MPTNHDSNGLFQQQSKMEWEVTKKEEVVDTADFYEMHSVGEQGALHNEDIRMKVSESNH